MPAQQKSQLRTRAQDKAAAARRYAKARRACVDAVWARAEGKCEQCGVKVFAPGTAVVWTRYGHVHEVRPRSLGGSATDPTNCLLLCASKCHPEAHRLKVGKAS